MFANFAKIDTPDALTVRTTTVEPSALLPFFLAEGTAPIQAASTAAANRTTPVGTGPYRFVKWTRGDSIELERYAEYKGAVQPCIKAATIRFVPDENAQVLAMRSGQVDYLPYLAAVEAINCLKADNKFKVTQGQTQGVLFLGMNNKKAPFNDVRVRRAMYAAIDAQSGMKVPMGASARRVVLRSTSSIRTSPMYRSTRPSTTWPPPGRCLPMPVIRRG